MAAANLARSAKEGRRPPPNAPQAALGVRAPQGVNSRKAMEPGKAAMPKAVAAMASRRSRSLAACGRRE
eukprot:15308290-Alexandrium_andersonii.AAC.1